MSKSMLDVPFLTIRGRFRCQDWYVDVFRDMLAWWKHTRVLAANDQVISSNSELST